MIHSRFCRSLVSVATALFCTLQLDAATPLPENLVAENIPPVPPELSANAARYLEFRSASFQGWHPSRRELLLTTRFADTMQLHHLKSPGGARKQLTFLPEPVGAGAFNPNEGSFIVFSQDKGGGEFFQLFRYDLEDGKISLLTDGKSRNAGARWSNRGPWLAYSSTRRTGRDNDLYVIDPKQPSSDRLLMQVSGGGWQIQDWSEDDSQLLVMEYVSINESYLYRVDAKTGAKELLTPKTPEKIAYGQAQFAKGARAVYLTTDKDSEFQRLARLDLESRQLTPLTTDIRWDVDEFDLSPDGKVLAFVTNENGIGVLHLWDTGQNREIPAPKLPIGVLSGLKWHKNSRDLGFNLSSAKSPADIYSFDLATGRIDRWTES
ncbi:MAG: S9 family peptidase, partial [Verrucomicrobiota bacterium]